MLTLAIAVGIRVPAVRVTQVLEDLRIRVQVVLRTMVLVVRVTQVPVVPPMMVPVVQV
jgi:hypothetical protein